MRLSARNRYRVELDADEVVILAAVIAKINRPSAGFTRLTFTDEELSMIDGLDKALNTDGE